MKHLRRRRVSIQDVAVRDGFQIDHWQIPTSETIALIDPLARTELAKVEFTAFVSSKAVP